MSKLESFYFWAAILGVIVNFITLTGLNFNLIDDTGTILNQPTGSFLLLSTFLVYLYSAAGLVFSFFNGAAKRWEKLGYAPTKQKRDVASTAVMFGLWIPFYIMWSYVFWEELNKILPHSDSWPFFMTYVFFTGTVGMLVPLLLAAIAQYIYEYLNPHLELP